ncbi:hypothetical protein CPB83DRAFT_844171 [Crepidotus variabilis]|uniref:Uncharacterized protein n=1 Tax=Crepidotus variabilis TaxID=179855 RepID=A0A9P6JVV7_9AGAR|nr:hypothetical protein CPB83DRAFT_844171 [Crepidotus variabilis]
MRRCHMLTHTHISNAISKAYYIQRHMWRKYVATDLATSEGFADSPSLTQGQLYHYSIV